MSLKIKIEELLNSSLKNCFKLIENDISKETTVDDYTKLFTNLPFTETKPYLIRRQVQPIDKRFTKIEIVYDENNNVRALVWYIKISLNQLRDFFGSETIQEEPYSGSTAFFFKSENKSIRVIKTRFPRYLEKNSDTNYFESDKSKIKNPEFDFIQFDV